VSREELYVGDLGSVRLENRENLPEILTKIAGNAIRFEQPTFV
jgi:hypothetical protein